MRLLSYILMCFTSLAVLTSCKSDSKKIPTVDQGSPDSSKDISGNSGKARFRINVVAEPPQSYERVELIIRQGGSEGSIAFNDFLSASELSSQEFVIPPGQYHFQIRLQSGIEVVLDSALCKQASQLSEQSPAALEANQSVTITLHACPKGSEVLPGSPAPGSGNPVIAPGEGSEAEVNLTIIAVDL